jgi:TrbC/VIRB2 pilin
MLGIRCAFRLEKPLNRSSNPTAIRWPQHFSTRTLRRAVHVMGPTFVALAFESAANVAHAQGTISFSGAQTFMQTVQTFAEYAGAVICLIGLIFAGISFMSGNIQRGVIGLFGAIFGAGVLGWGAGWISSLTGQSVS